MCVCVGFVLVVNLDLVVSNPFYPRFAPSVSKLKLCKLLLSFVCLFTLKSEKGSRVKSFQNGLSSHFRVKRGNHGFLNWEARAHMGLDCVMGLWKCQLLRHIKHTTNSNMKATVC